MRRLILLALCAGSCTILLGNTEASAFGRSWLRSHDFGFTWYRTWDSDYAVHEPFCDYKFKGHAWNYAAPYYFTHDPHRYRRSYRAARPVCHLQK